ncbi:MAG: gamma-glutamylcyclotransferase family protein [Opitutus sp.]
MNSSARQLVFVYGTLKRGGSNHSFMSGQINRGDARTMPGFSLIDLGDYPGLVADSANEDGVSGEVWSVDLDCLSRLDDLEGVSEGLYRRERVVLRSSFGDEPVETYVYALNVVGRPVIADGIWRTP